MKLILKPTPEEYAPYYGKYISLVPDDGMVLQHLYNNRKALDTLLSPLSPERWEYRYAEGKWSVKESLLHIIDTERIFAYRALRIARGDTTPLPGYEQDDYVPLSGANTRSGSSLLEEHATVRQATLTLFGNLPEEAWGRMGTASNNPVSVRALAYMLAGHELHHLTLFKERYLA
jgi:hypothetical protein